MCFQKKMSQTSCESNSSFQCLPGAKAGQGTSHSKCSTNSTFGDPLSSYNQQVFSLFFSIEAALLHVAEPPLHHDQYLLMQSLHQLSLQQPVMTLEAFLSQVAWAGVQLPSIRGVISLILVMMMSQMLELMMIMLRTSLLHMKLGIQGPHRIKAHFDKNFSLIF